MRSEAVVNVLTPIRMMVMLDPENGGVTAPEQGRLSPRSRKQLWTAGVCSKERVYLQALNKGMRDKPQIHSDQLS